MLITFIGLQAAGYTLNILTLGALTIAIGRVVDDSIVVIENIKRHLVARRTVDGAHAPIIVAPSARSRAPSRRRRITTVAVFLPIAFVGGITGELFRPFALTVTIALLASLFVALTIVPVLAYWFLRRRRCAEAHAGDGRQSASPGAGDRRPPGRPSRSGSPSTPTPRRPPERPVKLDRRCSRVYLPVLAWTLKHAGRHARRRAARARRHRSRSPRS